MLLALVCASPGAAAREPGGAGAAFGAPGPGDGPGADGGTSTGIALEAGTDIDTDGDGVADLRDVCIGDTNEGDAIARRRAGDRPSAVRIPRGDDPVAAPGCPSGARVGLAGIGFETGSSRLDLPARRLLDRLAASLGAGDPDEVWEVGAHTDGRGPRSRNLALSLRRAESVRHYLMLRGVTPERLVAKGYGEGEPVASDATARGRAANRRVELRRAPAPPPTPGR